MRRAIWHRAGIAFSFNEKAGEKSCAIEFRRGGLKMSQDSFFTGIMEDALEEVMSSYGDELHGKAASVVDPDTGKHVPVFVRRIGKKGWAVHTSGSPAFARALEQRLGLNKGEVHGMNEPANRERLVYLAHASEDKAMVKPLTEGLMQRGINVWYDNWEIGYGDSLRRKMEEVRATRCTVKKRQTGASCAVKPMLLTNR
jgi:hypothetical protein